MSKRLGQMLIGAASLLYVALKGWAFVWLIVETPETWHGPICMLAGVAVFMSLCEDVATWLGARPGSRMDDSERGRPE